MDADPDDIRRGTLEVLERTRLFVESDDVFDYLETTHTCVSGA